MDTEKDELAQLAALKLRGTPAETIDMLQEVYQEQPDAVAKAAGLLQEGWTMTLSGHQNICIILRSANGDSEVLGHGSSILDAFEEVQRKTANFTKLSSSA